MHTEKSERSIKLLCMNFKLLNCVYISLATHCTSIIFTVLAGVLMFREHTFNFFGGFREHLFCEAGDLVGDAGELREVASEPRHC